MLRQFNKSDGTQPKEEKDCQGHQEHPSGERSSATPKGNQSSYNLQTVMSTAAFFINRNHFIKFSFKLKNFSNGEKLAHIQEIDNYFNIWWPFIKYSEKYKLYGCQILQHDLLQSVAVQKQLNGTKGKSRCWGERWLVFWPPMLFLFLPFKKQYTCQRFTWCVISDQTY